MTKKTSDQYAWRNALQDSALPQGPKLVGQTLLRWVNTKSGYCFPSQASIAEKASVTDRTVRNSLKALIEAGFLEVVVSKGPGRSSSYQLTIPETISGIEVQEDLTPETISGYNRKDVPVMDLIPENDDTNTGNHFLLTNKELTNKELLCAEAPAVTKKETITSVWLELKEALENLLESEEYDGNALGAYSAIQRTISAMAPGISHLSQKPAEYLNNNLIAHAAGNFHEWDDYKELARLNKAAKQMGSTGTFYILKALAYTVGMSDKDNPIQYVIGTARKQKEEAK